MSIIMCKSNLEKPECKEEINSEQDLETVYMIYRLYRNIL